MVGWQVSVGSFNVDSSILGRMPDLNPGFDVIPTLATPLMSEEGRSCPITPIDFLPEGVYDKVRVNSLASAMLLDRGTVLPPAFHPIPIGSLTYALPQILRGE